MNCFLPWNLKDMTNISADKLQKNIGQQISYLEMYRSELLKESLRFNVASLLRHLILNRNSFNSDDLSRRATDCLIVFLHSTAFLKKAYFAPTDAENPSVGKCVRNLHRLMLENVKTTMKYLDYYLLLDVARGKIEQSEMFEKRRAIHEQVFPDSDVPTPFKNDALGSEFLKLVELESSGAHEFSDFDVQKHSAIPSEICQRLSSTTRRDDELPDSRFGIIGACRTYLDTPFIRYGNTFYSFVVPYSLSRIAELTEGFELQTPIENQPETITVPEQTPEPETPTEPEVEVQEEERVFEAEAEVEPEPEQESEIEQVPEPEQEPETEPVPEPEQEPETELESEQIPETESEPVSEEPTEPEAETEIPTEPDDYDSPFDEDDEIEVESDRGDTLASDDDSAYYETDEYEYPDEFEEDNSDSVPDNQEEPDVYEVAEEVPDESNQSINPNDDSYYDEEPYTALVSPDTYDYLEEAQPDEFTSDPMLEEQDSLEDAYDEYEDETQKAESETEDEPEPYSGSLFDFLDDTEEEPEKTEEPEEDILDQKTDENQDDSFPPFEEEEASPEPESESEPETEQVPEPEPEPAPEPEPVVEEPIKEDASASKLPLLDQILSFSPSRNNPITQYLTGCSFDNQKEIVRVIELARKSWLIDGKDKMFTIPDTNISVAVFQETHDPMVGIQRRENIGAVMYSVSKDTWNSLELSYDKSGQLVKADFNRISKSDFSDWEWKVVEKLGIRIIERRSK